MKWFSITTLLVGLCVAYIGHTVWTMYHLYHIPSCVAASSKSTQCLHSWLFLQASDGSYSHQQLALSVYGSSSEKNSAATKRSLLYQNSSLDFFATQEINVNASIPNRTFKTGKYYIHMYVHPRGVDALSGDNKVSYASGEVTQLSVPKLEAFNLMGENKKSTQTAGEAEVPHWRSRVTLSVMTDDISFDARKMPGELYPYIAKRIDQVSRSYFPIAIVDKISFRLRDLLKLENTKTEMPLTIVYQPISVGKLRLWTNFELSFKLLGGYGFGEKEIDEVKGIFVDTNFYFLIMTLVVSALHILFDTLAFKNDISYWRKRETMVGLSSRVVVWRCVSTIIILFYLIDADTSLLVSVPTGISALIEMWKLKKAFKISFHLSSKPITFGNSTDKEKETEEFDAVAMGYLNYLLYPLLIAGAIYSLLYTPHKSWYSWCLKSLVNGVYAFGFLFMLPQLFVNYKLKSVAHLPWRAFMYKAFNTFIDDIFAFIITMPTAHRVACFRDDLVFVIYLYQRWLYPVDKTRVNEFGQSFEKDSESTEKSKTD